MGARRVPADHPAVVTVRQALAGLVVPVAEQRRAQQRRRNVPPLDAATELFGTGERAVWDRPSPTILTVPKLFHPEKPRLFAIAELRRLCSFPEDFCV